MTLSAETVAGMFDEETGDGLLVLLTINHPDFSTPIRVVNNKVDVPSRGDTFTSFPFDIVLPSSEVGSGSVARLTIDNVSREIVSAIRLAGSVPPTVLIEVVRLKDTEVLEFSFPPFRIRNVRADVTAVSGDLFATDLQTEPYPALTFTPGFFPGLF